MTSQVLTGHSSADLFFLFNTDMDMDAWGSPGGIARGALDKALEVIRLREQVSLPARVAPSYTAPPHIKCAPSYTAPPHIKCTRS
jgi:hypothetical protein